MGAPELAALPDQQVAAATAVGRRGHTRGGRLRPPARGPDGRQTGETGTPLLATKITPPVRRRAWCPVPGCRRCSMPGPGSC